MHKTLRAVVGLCVAGVAMFSMAGAAGAQIPGYEPEPTLEFEYPTQVESGGDITITGNCTEGGDVVFTIGDEEIGTVETDVNGDFEATFDVPNLTPGTYTIEGVCSGLVASGDIEVLAAGTDPGDDTNNAGGPLARTGFNPLPVVTLGAAALVLGGAAVYGSKRRRTVA
jgi:hypothetical protein